jgi:hypothetical protein
MLRRVVWYKLTNVSEVLIASIIRAISKCRQFLPEYTAQHPRRQTDTFNKSLVGYWKRSFLTPSVFTNKLKKDDKHLL